MEKLLRNHAEKIRYMLVGGFNTLLDFVLLFFFVSLGIDKIPANYISTGIAMVISFFANKSFTFKDTNARKKRQFTLFIAVTVVGMWVIQPVVIWLSSLALESYTSNESLSLFIAKLVATGASLVWNYYLYSRVVFKKGHRTPEEDL